MAYEHLPGRITSYRSLPSSDAKSVALAAAAAVGGDLVGVDLAATGASHTVIEVNGCVDFTTSYSPRDDTFARAAAALTSVADPA